LLPPRRFHDLWHTFATPALEAGERLDAVSRALGHTSLATTDDFCAHLTSAMAVNVAGPVGLQRVDVDSPAHRPGPFSDTVAPAHRSIWKVLHLTVAFHTGTSLQVVPKS
jgi:hypothetical protein